MGNIEDFAGRSIEKAGFSPRVEGALRSIQAELADAYRESFLEMVEAMKQQASALSRIQHTLNIIIEHLQPQLEGKLPIALRVAEGTEAPDVATALIVADPIGAGYTLSQADLAKALNVSSADVSILVGAFKLKNDGNCSVVVRKGRRNTIINYHPRAVDRFRELIAHPPDNLSAPEKSALRRVRRKLGPAFRY